MTLPQNVKDAVKSLECEIADPEDCTAWQTIRAHLLSQEAEIERLRDVVGETAQMGEDSERCLAAANALLRECQQTVMSLHPATYGRIQTHLQGAGDE